MGHSRNLKVFIWMSQSEAPLPLVYQGSPFLSGPDLTKQWDCTSQGGLDCERRFRSHHVDDHVTSHSNRLPPISLVHKHPDMNKSSFLIWSLCHEICFCLNGVCFTNELWVKGNRNQCLWLQVWQAWVQTLALYQWTLGSPVQVSSVSQFTHPWHGDNTLLVGLLYVVMLIVVFPYSRYSKNDAIA